MRKIRSTSSSGYSRASRRRTLILRSSTKIIMEWARVFSGEVMGLSRSGSILYRRDATARGGARSQRRRRSSRGLLQLSKSWLARQVKYILRQVEWNALMYFYNLFVIG